jgi:hypothetical protein
MSRPTITLDEFDQLPIIEYNITSSDLAEVHRYLQAMQSHLDEGTWEEICLGGYYGVSALLHEVVELRVLLSRDAYLLTRSNQEIRAFARNPDNHEAHLRGLEAEYRYLQSVIQRVFGRSINIGALAQANTHRPDDWEDLFETSLPFLEPSAEELIEAEELLVRLRRLEKRS